MNRLCGMLLSLVAGLPFDAAIAVDRTGSTGTLPALVHATDVQNPFQRAPSPDSAETSPRAEVTRAEADPFRRTVPPSESEGQRVAPGEVACGPGGTLSRAELRKPEMAIALCARNYDAIDEQWLFNLYYIKGFNDFLEERGSFMDPTGACARAAEPRHRLGLIYEGMNYLLGRSDSLGNPRLAEMLRPFREDWKQGVMIWMEVRAWEREGRLDATSIASRGMCGDPEFELFWSNALVYAQRVPGTTR